MKEKIREIRAVTILALAMVASGCSIDGDRGVSGGVDQIHLDLTVSGVDVATNSSRASSDVDAVSSVKNLWVVQHKENGDYVDSEYYDSYDYGDYVSIDRSKTHSLVLLVNTFADDLIDDTTAPSLSDVLDLKNSITATHDSVLTNDYCVMSAYVEPDYFAPDFNAAAYPVEVSSNVVQINVEIKNFTTEETDPTKKWTLYKAETLNIPMTSHLAPHANFTAAESTPDTFPTYSAEDWGNHEWSDEDRTAASTTDGLTFYLPINKRGIVTDYIFNNGSKDKPTYAPDGATAIRLYLQNVDVMRSYTFFLGANMTNDYNLAPHSTYSYLFSIYDGGYPDSDPRIDVILIPMNVGDLTVDGFGGSDSNDEYEGDEIGSSYPSLGNSYEDQDAVTVNP